MEFYYIINKGPKQVLFNVPNGSLLNFKASRTEKDHPSLKLHQHFQ